MTRFNWNKANDQKRMQVKGYEEASPRGGRGTRTGQRSKLKPANAKKSKTSSVNTQPKSSPAALRLDTKLNLAELEAVIQSLSCPGNWKVLQYNGKQFIWDNGAVLSWWPNGTVLFQGNHEMQRMHDLFKAAMNFYLPPNSSGFQGGIFSD